MSKVTRNKKIKKLDKKLEKIFKESDVMLLLEHLNDNITIIAEGQSITDRKVDRISEELSALNEKFLVLDGKVFALDGRVSSLQGDFIEFKSETKSNFKTVFEYLSRIDDEVEDIKKKLDKMDKNSIKREEFEKLQERVYSLEKQIAQYKMILKDK